MLKYFAGLFVILIFSTCSTYPTGPNHPPDDSESPKYEDLRYWASSPFKEDNADRIPGFDNKNLQENVRADVFFLHPTTYTRQRGNTNWNGPVTDEKLNAKTDNGTILYQASVFNETARIFAPRYRQAHIYAMYELEEEEQEYADKAMDFAYRDIKKAFEYYLEYHHNDRPIIIASHSQGSVHAIRLIKEFIEGKELLNEFIAAYLIGMPIRENTFSIIHPCQKPDDLQCYCSWRTFQRDYLPKWHEYGSNIVVTNPLNWSTDSLYMPKEFNKGTLTKKFEDGLFPGIADAQVYEDHLWVTKPKFKGSIFLPFKNYHIADYNLFYANIKENAALRVRTFLKEE